MSGIFVTGTDTGIGKTWVATALLRAIAEAGLRGVGMKPVAAGIDPGAQVNADVDALAGAGNVDAPLALRNPYAFADAVAPQLAARAAGVVIRLDVIAGAYAQLAQRADVVVVEGAGGALVPLDARHDMLDIAAALDLPVLLVVGMRLGCVNHALLSSLAIRARGLSSPAGSPIGCHRKCCSPRRTSVRLPSFSASRRSQLCLGRRTVSFLGTAIHALGFA